MRTVIEYQKWIIKKAEAGEYMLFKKSKVKHGENQGKPTETDMGYYSSFRGALVRLRDEVASQGSSIAEIKGLLGVFDKDFKEALAVVQFEIKG